MKILSQIFSVISIAVFLCASCVSNISADDSPDVKPDVQEIQTLAEFASADDSVKTVKIKANRSWYLHLNDLSGHDPKDFSDTVDWVYSSVREHVNMTNVSDESEVKLTFHRNTTSKSRSCVLNIWSKGRIISTVDILQEGACFRLNVNPERTVATCDVDTVSVHVDCNTNWSARVVDEKTTAEVSLINSSGYDPGDILVVFNENLDPESTKTATIEIVADECETKTFEIIQSKGIPYLSFDGNKNPSLIKAGLNEIVVEVSTNISDVKGEAVGGSIKDISIEKLDLKHFKVTFVNPSDDPHIFGDATIRFSTDKPGFDPVEYNFRQPGSLSWIFFDGDLSTLNVFGLPMKAPDKPGVNPAQSIEPLITTAGNSYRIYQLGYVYGRKDNKSSGLVINGGKGSACELIFPIVDGYVLSRITFTYYYHSSLPGTKEYVGEAKDFTISEDLKTAVYTTSGHYTGLLDAKFQTGLTTHSFVLGQLGENEVETGNPILSPQPNKAYLIHHTTRLSLVRNIVLSYDPVSDNSND